jgi:trigger factor
MSNRPPISDPILRQVRQRCGFGCVICGLPLYDYDHISGWANVKRHDVKEITLLCNKHHAEKTKGLLTIEQVAEANRDPINIRQGVSAPYGFHFAGREATIRLGGNEFYFDVPSANEPSYMVGVSVDDNDLLAFTFVRGQLFLHANIFNELNQCVLRIINNELVYATDTWDIKFKGQTRVRLLALERRRERSCLRLPYLPQVP